MTDDFSSALEDISEFDLPNSLSVYTLADAEDAASILSTALDTSPISDYDYAHPPTEIYPIARVLTSTSVATVLPSAQILRTSLRELCVLISSHVSLQTAKIVSTEGYAMITNAIVHRFLLLELRRDGKRGIWLRLDRLRGRKGSMFKFLRNGGVSDANDRVCTRFIFSQFPTRTNRITTFHRRNSLPTRAICSAQAAGKRVHKSSMLNLLLATSLIFFMSLMTSCEDTNFGP